MTILKLILTLIFYHKTDSASTLQFIKFCFMDQNIVNFYKYSFGWFKNISKKIKTYLMWCATWPTLPQVVVGTIHVEI